MYNENVVYFSPNGNVITLVIRPYYATNGAYEVWITDGTALLKVGKGSFADGIDDIFVLPVATSVLQNWQVIIVGTYASSYGHTQILVNYSFYQNGVLLNEEISINHTGSSIAIQNDITFENL